MPLQAHLQAYLDAGGTEDFEVEFRLRTKTGQWLWILGKGQSVAWNAEGTPTRLIGMNIDIQRPKTAQEALRGLGRKIFPALPILTGRHRTSKTAGGGVVP